MPKTSKSRNTTDRLPPVHPGEILKETLDDLGISMNRLSREIHVPADRISSIIAGQRAITGETALRLARYFDTTPEYWLNMQTRYDFETARDQWEDRVESEVRPRHAAYPSIQMIHELVGAEASLLRYDHTGSMKWPPLTV